MRAFAQAPSAESTTPGNGNPFSLGVFAAMLVCAAAFLGIGAPAASAAPEAQPGFAYLNSFGEGEYSPFVRVRHMVAVDSSGNIFAIDQNHGRVRISAPDPALGGTPLTVVNVEAAGMYPADLVIDPSDDSFYANDPAISGVIKRFESDGQPTPTYTVDAGFGEPAAGEDVAVDPTSQDLLVADGGSESVRRYDSSGTLVETIPTSGVSAQLIAAAPDGTFYLSQNEGSTISHFSGSGTLIQTISSQGSVRAIGVDPSDGRLVVVLGGSPETIRIFSSSGSFISNSFTTQADQAMAIDGASGRLYGTDGTKINVFVPATVPGIETPVVSELQRHSVHVSAEVDPGSGPPAESKAHFEWSDDGGTTWHSTPDQAVTGPTTIEADLTGLKLNLDYLVRARATNEGAVNTTVPVPFSTPEVAPEVVTGFATDVTEDSAVLNGTVDPGGVQTTYYFEYGTTEAYGSKVPAGIEAVAGNGRDPRRFGRTITNLQPGTEYHFRIVATSTLGVTEGADETFTTVAAAGTPQRAYEQVTPADKKGIAIESGFGFFAKADGEGMAYLTKGGGAGAPLNARSITYRGAEDWQPGPDLDPPLDVVKTGIVSQATLGLSPDFSKALVVSNEELTPGAAGGEAANLYLFDIASRTYTLVGSTPDFSPALNFFTGFGAGGQFLASAPDMSWMVFYSQMPLIEGAAFNSLYRWSEAAGLEIVSILPGPSETPATVFEITAYNQVLPWTSADGSKIYFETVDPEPGVYLRENGETKAISVSEVPGEPGGARPAQLLGTSEDGRYAFFGMNEPNVKLTSDAPGEYGDLYRYDASDESLEYLGAPLLTSSGSATYASGLAISPDGETIYFRTPGDTKVWREGELRQVSPVPIQSENATASPSGRYLAFVANGKLNFYDAVTEEVTCASCFPDGTPGEASLPNLINRTIGNYLPLSVTDSGQFFFTSSSRLVAADVNGVNDVYEYRDGKLRLVSPGNAPFPATFADVSRDGRDVFFTTQQKLVGRDNDQSVDIYDARIDGGLPAQSPPAPQECLRDDCKATPNAGPELPFGGSEALSGPENVKPPKHKKCGKGKKAKNVKGKVRCVKKHKANKNKKGGNR